MNRACTRSPTPATVPCEVERHAVLVDPAEADELGAQLRGQAGGLLVGVDEQQRRAARRGCRPATPRAADGSACSRGAGVEQPAVLVVVAQHRLVAVAQPQRRVAFPLVGEAAGLGQLVAAPGAGEQVHPAAGADRGELAVVADQQQLRPGRVDVAVDRGERRRCRSSRTRRPRPGRPACSRHASSPSTGCGRRAGTGGEPVLGGEPARDVARGQALAGEDVGGDLARWPARTPARRSARRAGRGRSRRGRARRRRTTCRCRPGRPATRPGRRR